MAPRKPQFDPDAITAVNPAKTWVPVSILVSAVGLALMVGAGYTRIMLKLDTIEANQWTTGQMREYGYVAQSKNPGWNPPDTTLILKRP